MALRSIEPVLPELLCSLLVPYFQEGSEMTKLPPACKYLQEWGISGGELFNLAAEWMIRSVGAKGKKLKAINALSQGRDICSQDDWVRVIAYNHSMYCWRWWLSPAAALEVEASWGGSMYNGKKDSLATGSRLASCNHVVWFAIACGPCCSWHVPYLAYFMPPSLFIKFK